jgi:uncharacterized protein YgfB (UPF0149 family)
MNQLTEIEASELDRLLKAASAASDAAEAHGAFCGRACFAGAAAIRSWQQELLADADPDNVLTVECARALETAAASALLKLEAGDMQFNLLLPGDDEPLYLRAAALVDWCHGFMQGLIIGGGADPSPQSDALDSAIASEILDDFSEITKAGVSDEDGEEAEQAFAELVEYVRVSTQLMYDETMELRTQPSGLTS